MDPYTHGTNNLSTKQRYKLRRRQASLGEQKLGGFLLFSFYLRKKLGEKEKATDWDGGKWLFRTVLRVSE